jgi:hypothetical protein
MDSYNQDDPSHALEDPGPQDQESIFTPEALDASAQADAELEALEDIADYLEENFDEIADATESTEELWEDFHNHFGRSERELEAFREGNDISEVSDAQEEPDTPTGADDSPEPEPGDLDWRPSETGVKYPDPERKEGNVGGPERLG